jgi:hypothetical protein
MREVITEFDFKEGGGGGDVRRKTHTKKHG